MFKNERKSLAMPVAVVAAIIMMCAACFAFMGTAEAKTFPDQGIEENLTEAATITIAPGFSYNYEITFPESLVDGVEVTIPVNTLPSGTTAELNEANSGAVWGTLHVEIPKGTANGTYDLVLKAYHEASNQTAYQYIIFDVKEGATITPASFDFGYKLVSQGFEQTFTLQSAFGYVASANVQVDGMTLTSDASVTFEGQLQTQTMTVTGTFSGPNSNVTVTINALTSEGEPFTFTDSFIVYSDLSATLAADQIGTTDGSSDSSEITGIPSDLTGVTYSADVSALAEKGVTFDDQTGKVTVTGGAYIDTTVTVTVNHAASGQTATQTVTIQNEGTDASFDLTTEDTYFQSNTYYAVAGEANRATALTAEATLVAQTGFSGFKTGSWTVSGMDGVVSINDAGVISIDASVASATASTQITVGAETEFGMAVSKTFNLVIEGDLTFTADDGQKIVLINSEGKNTGSLSFTAEAANAVLSYDDGDYSEASPFDAALNEAEQKIDFGINSQDEVYTYTLTVNTIGGQSETLEFTVEAFALLSFTSTPTNDVEIIGA